VSRVKKRTPLRGCQVLYELSRPELDREKRLLRRLPGNMEEVWESCSGFGKKLRKKGAGAIPRNKTTKTGKTTRLALDRPMV